MLLAIREGGINRPHHRDHPSGDLLGLLFIGRPIFDVAVGACSFFQEAQCRHKALHGGRDVRSNENLDVLAASSASITRR